MPITTSTTLLRDISGDPQHPRWEDFVACYRQYMVEIVRTQFPDIEVEDVVQETLIALAKVLPSYQYAPDENGRFRNYLAGIVLNKAKCAHRCALKERRLMDELQAVSTESQTRAEAEKMEWKRQLFEVALHGYLVDPLVTDWTKEVFVRVAINGESPDEVAKALQTNRNRIDQVKSRSMSKIRKLIEALEEIAYA